MTDTDALPEGVPATTLWTLHNRAVEAARNDDVLSDPKAQDGVSLFKLSMPASCMMGRL